MDLSLKNAHILIVDDEQANIDVLSGLLELKDYTNVYTTTDSRLVVELYKEINPDIILLDLMMPHYTGFQIMEQLMPLIPHGIYLPILVLTADVTTDSKLRALSGGAKDFLTKPFDLMEVDIRITNLLQTRYLHKQLQNQNILLEDKVRKRTTELQNTIIELEIAKTKAESSDRLKTAFMNNISHELRTPLNGILGFSQIIADPDLSSDEKEGYLVLLNESSDRLLNTVTNYLDISLLVSGTQKVKYTMVDIQALLQEVYHYFQSKCTAKNLDLILPVEKTQNHILVKTDKGLLQKTLSHLIDNAIKFTKKGSITMGCQFNNVDFEIFVKDTGKGIAKEAQKLIFDGFMQENVSNTRVFEGSGLGLSITIKIIELLGGTLQIESDIGQGTTIRIKLPII